VCLALWLFGCSVVRRFGGWAFWLCGSLALGSWLLSCLAVWIFGSWLFISLALSPFGRLAILTAWLLALWSWSPFVS